MRKAGILGQLGQAVDDFKSGFRKDYGIGGEDARRVMHRIRNLEDKTAEGPKMSLMMGSHPMAQRVRDVTGTATEIGEQARAEADMGGSIAGDFVGMYGGDALLRAKGGGMSPWEKMQMEGNEQMRQEMEQQIMAQYGIAGYRPHQLLSEEGFA